MAKVLAFPKTPSAPRELPPLDTSSQAADAGRAVQTLELFSAFVDFAIPGLESITCLIKEKLNSMDDDAVTAIWEAIELDPAEGAPQLEVCLLEDIVAIEVVRRCALSGRRVPWEKDEAEIKEFISGSGDPDPGGAA